MRIGIIVSVAIGVCRAQTPITHGPQFEVASIKPSAVPPGLKYAIDDSRADLRGMSLKSLITISLGVESYQVTAPDWTSTALFDISANLPENTNKDQFPQMLHTLLTDRFGLVVHHEPKEQQVYALIPGKEGPKLDAATSDNNDRTFVTGRAILTRMITPEADGFWSVSTLNGRNVFDAARITMPELANALKPYVDDPVIDMTGLKGYWQVRIDVPKNNARLRAMLAANGAGAQTEGPPDPEGVSIFASLQKLGLILDHRKASVDHIVVDHVEKTPTEN